ncbi:MULTISPECIES: acyl carrier protein [Polymorphospora]|uniref:Acyl carrier protein n=1 Tax=Polymorphospora lycopeni TaxID=3140240 RepID=A0ABV5CSB2_9ACTN
MTAAGPLHQRLAELVHEATGGAVPVADALAGDVPLVALGLDSLGLLRLIDAIESEYDVEIDLQGNTGSLDDIAAHLAERVSATPPTGRLT